MGAFTHKIEPGFKYLQVANRTQVQFLRLAACFKPISRVLPHKFLAVAR